MLGPSTRNGSMSFGSKMLTFLRRLVRLVHVPGAVRATALALLLGLPLWVAAQVGSGGSVGTVGVVGTVESPVRFGILPLGGAFESRSD